MESRFKKFFGISRFRKRQGISHLAWNRPERLNTKSVEKIQTAIDSGSMGTSGFEIKVLEGFKQALLQICKDKIQLPVPRRRILILPTIWLSSELRIQQFRLAMFW